MDCMVILAQDEELKELANQHPHIAAQIHERYQDVPRKLKGESSVSRYFSTKGTWNIF